MQYKEAMLIIAITTLTAKHIDDMANLKGRYYRTSKGGIRLEPRYIIEWTKCSMNDLVQLVNRNEGIFDISHDEKGNLIGISALL